MSRHLRSQQQNKNQPCTDSRNNSLLYRCFDPTCTFQTFNSRGFWNHLAHTGHTYNNNVNKNLLSQLNNQLPMLYELIHKYNCVPQFLSTLHLHHVTVIDDSNSFCNVVNKFMADHNLHYDIQFDDDNNSYVSMLSAPINTVDNIPINITTNITESFFGYTINDIAEIELMALVQDLNAPLYAFQKIMEWAQRAYNNGYTFTPTNKTYRGQIATLEQKIPNMYPRAVLRSVKLHPDNFEAYVPVFDFVLTFTSLLEDPVLNQIHNLDVNYPCNLRFQKFIPPNNVLDSVNSGLWYDMAYNNLIQNPETDFLAPLIFAFDECVLSSQSNLSVLALYFTTTLFNYNTRTQPNAWKILGYIPNDRNYYSKQQLNSFTSNDKSLRLHQLLEAVLDSLIQTQQNETLNNFSLRLGKYRKRVNLKIPVFFIIGDLQGGDKLAGRILNYNMTAKRISRCCDATPDCFDGPGKHQCNRLIMKDVALLLQSPTEANLRAIDSLYQQPHWNAFFNVEFGHPYGIFTAACPVEGLHALENGLIKDALNEIFQTILSSQQVKELDAIVQSWGQLPKQQQLKSKHNEFPRLLFLDGISTLTDTTAAHKVGMLFATTVAFLTFPGHKLLTKAERMKRHQHTEQNIIVDTTYVLEMLLCFWQWLKKPSYWERNNDQAYEQAQQSITNFMSELHLYLPRLLGQGWDTCKFHEMVHIALNIVLFGAHRNVHSGPAEHNHISLAKQPSEQTQKNRKTLEHEIAHRFVDRQIVSYFHNKIKFASNESSRQQFWDDVTEAMTNSSIESNNSNKSIESTPVNTCSKRATKMHLQFTKLKFGLQLSILNNLHKEQNLLHIIDQTVYNELTSSISLRLQHKPIGTTIQICLVTFITRNDTIFHAHWKTETQSRWNDWVFIAWNEIMEKNNNISQSKSTYVPGQIQLLYNIVGTMDYFAIVHSCKYEHEKHSVLSVRWELEYNTNLHLCMQYDKPWSSRNLHMLHASSQPVYRTVSVNAIQEHCLVLPFHPNSSAVLQIVHASHWADLFSTV